MSTKTLQLDSTIMKKFINVEVLETICENVELTKNNPTYTFPSEITLDSSALYWLDGDCYDASGKYIEKSSIYAIVPFDGNNVKPIEIFNGTYTQMTLSSTSLKIEPALSYVSLGSNTWTVSLKKINITYPDRLLWYAVSKTGSSENIASNLYSHTEGGGTTASGTYSHAEGGGTTASGEYSHAEGGGTASGLVAHAEGVGTTASGDYSHAEGAGTTASGDYSHAEGSGTKATGKYSHAEGYQTTASGIQSHAGGYYTQATSYQAVAFGYYTKALEKQCSIGIYNDPKEQCSAGGTTGTLFTVGNGTSDTARSNVFRVAQDGKCYGQNAFVASGADYAEMFEWADGNPNNEDRRGKFVTLDGEYIRIANSSDGYILGIISADPVIIGDHDEEWKNMYKRDVFGQLITEEKTNEYSSDDPDTCGNDQSVTVTALVLNPEWDNTKKYVARKDRPEWGMVGMLGKLVVIDDGSCQVNSYCKVADGGIATASDSGYRVMKRIDDTHVKILFR